ncbi:MAG: 1-deoxy-D-xylulose-5-phosphate reductoisomerase [bacterium]
MKKKISILGATGSIGTQTLDVIKNNLKYFEIVGLSAHKNVKKLQEQILEFNPKLVAVSTKETQKIIHHFIKKNHLTTRVMHGKAALNTIANEKQDMLVIAIIGTIALEPCINAIKNQTPIGLANKEILVAAGDIITSLVKKYKGKLIPIDSEHAAIQQCIEKKNKKTIKKIILTASGGPFWNTPHSHFKKITLKDALKHPTWSMGNKISIDSATMMNKGLEIIEAHHLFQLPYTKIDAIIHPQSIIHCLVEFIDGNTLAHLSPTNMKFPIQNALTYPNKVKNSWPKLNFNKLNNLNFYPPNPKKFPLLTLAYDVGKKGGSYPPAMNAANDIANALFCQNKLSFIQLQNIIEEAIQTHTYTVPKTINDIIEIEKKTQEKIKKKYA